jgi:hypothetical protein
MKKETVDGPRRPCEHVNNGGRGLAPRRESEIDRACSASAPQLLAPPVSTFSPASPGSSASKVSASSAVRT